MNTFNSRIEKIIFSIIVVISLSSCINNPVRKKLANLHSSYYQGIHAFAAKLDGNKKAEAFYKNKKNIGREYLYDKAVAKSERDRVRYIKEQRRREAAKRKRIDNCKTAKGLASLYEKFVGGVNAGLNTRFGKSPIKGYQWGKKAAKKQIIPKAINTSCK